ncbi:peptidoglycan-binding protein [Roseitranquillus sediminis]|uniref:peptidoglycan-binding protein n=1 Tax=Roseitranquillus sediminis TaxID=2809051 RepID=UPI001D0C2E08|nr:peptidoglycan-binding protein [Roseitranquillus sediminis]MBM9593295.1 peptidoglycan-binding protein [Roseitranquillus sediminis]
MTIEISEADVRAIAPNPTDVIVAGIVQHQHYLPLGMIDNELRLAHFMAQLAHESAHFRRTLEFASGAAYEGRRDLGNLQKGDGTRYRGRGLIQTTGRANYREAAADIREIDAKAPDFEAEPDELERFPWALLSAVSYWRRRNINRHADRDDVVAVTRAINGGTNGLDDRKRYLRRTKRLWMEGQRAVEGDPVLRLGDKGNGVRDLQSALIEAGFAVLVDGDFGSNTEEAAREFQQSRGLKPDGIVGPMTWAALRTPPA